MPQIELFASSPGLARAAVGFGIYTPLPIRHICSGACKVRIHDALPSSSAAAGNPSHLLAQKAVYDAMATLPRDVKLTLLGLMLALFLGALDQTIVSTALPQIVKDLQGLDRYAWVATSYLLASTALVPIYGRLADLFHRKTIELWAIALFLLGSFLCGIAGEFGDLPLVGDGMNQLVLFRAIQGLGGAGLFAMAFIVIADLFPPAERGKYQGLIGATFGVSSVLGPWIGGLLTDHGTGLLPGVEGWRLVFYVNVPFGALALYVIIRHMPPLPGASSSGKFDLLAACWLLAGLVPLVLALSLDKQRYAWASQETLALFTAALFFLVLFQRRSSKSESPLLDFSLFQNPVFARSNGALFLLGGVFLSILVFLPLFMVNVLGVSATKAGTSLIPLSLGLVFGAISSGQLVSRFGRYKRLMLGGNILLVLGVLLLSRMTTQTGFGEATLYMVVCGIGLGPSFPLYTLAIQNAVPLAKLGQATSASQFFRQIGGAVGAAVMGTVLASTLATAFADRPSMSPRQMGEATMETVPSLRVDVEVLEAELRSRLAAAPEHTVDQQAQPQLRATEQVAIPAMVGSVRQAFATAVTTIFSYAIFLAMAALLVTLTVPELPLRTSEPSADSASPVHG